MSRITHKSFIINIESKILIISLFIVVNCNSIIQATQLSVGIEHDLSKPTYGLHGPSSSQLSYDDKNGINLKGTINDLLGPPIKIANGFNNMISGSKMAGVGNSLKSGGAVLGIDAKLLEAYGGSHLLKGGLLMGGAAAKTGLATAIGGLPGKKISSIIEVPVKVVAMKDLAYGKAMTGLGKMKAAEAVASKTKGENMIKEGEQLKSQGINQMVQGATEGLQNLGNMVQQTSGNAATAFKLLPIILDLPMGQEPQQQQQIDTTKTSQQHMDSPHLTNNAGALTGGSLFGGLTSLIPGLANDPLLGNRSPMANLFSGQNPHNSYAAVLNSTNPLTNLLMNPSMNPFILPLGSISGGPLGQALSGKQPGLGGSSSLLGGQSSYNYNLFPGVKMSETTSSYLPNIALQQQQQQAVKV